MKNTLRLTLAALTALTVLLPSGAQADPCGGCLWTMSYSAPVAPSPILIP